LIKNNVLLYYNQLNKIKFYKIKFYKINHILERDYMDKYDQIKLENQICFPLYALSREIIRLYKPILDKYNLTYTQYITMLVIWEKEKIGFKDLGRLLHLDSGTLTPVLKKLEAMELIHKYRSNEDDRIVIVEVTEKGSRLKENILHVPEEIYCKLNIETEKLFTLKKQLDEILTQISE